MTGVLYFLFPYWKMNKEAPALLPWMLTPPSLLKYRISDTSAMTSLVTVMSKAAGPCTRRVLPMSVGGTGRRPLTSRARPCLHYAAATMRGTLVSRRLLVRHEPSSLVGCLLGARGNGCARRSGVWLGPDGRGGHSLQLVCKASLSSKKGGPEEGEGREKAETEREKQEQQEEEPTHDDPPEEGEKIGFMRGLAYLTVAAIAAGSLYFIVDELMPSRMSANYLFNEAFDVVKANHEVLNRYGEPLKGYGRDGGGRREGRRNFVEHKNYVGEDGSKRLRIRFNIEGPFGHAFVFAEVTADMPKGQWMYLLVQDMQTGRVMTLEDNRAMYEAMSKSASPEERAALQALIQSGGSQR